MGFCQKGFNLVRNCIKNRAAFIPTQTSLNKLIFLLGEQGRRRWVRALFHNAHLRCPGFQGKKYFHALATRGSSWGLKLSSPFLFFCFVQSKQLNLYKFPFECNTLVLQVGRECSAFIAGEIQPKAESLYKLLFSMPSTEMNILSSLYLVAWLFFPFIIGEIPLDFQWELHPSASKCGLNERHTKIVQMLHQCDLLQRTPSHACYIRKGDFPLYLQEELHASGGKNCVPGY